MGLELGARIQGVLARGTALDRLLALLTPVSLSRVQNVATDALITAIQIDVAGPTWLAFQALASFIEICNLSIAPEALWLAILDSTLYTIDQLIAALFALGLSALLVEVKAA